MIYSVNVNIDISWVFTNFEPILVYSKSITKNYVVKYCFGPIGRVGIRSARYVVMIFALKFICAYVLINLLTKQNMHKVTIHINKLAQQQYVHRVLAINFNLNLLKIPNYLQFLHLHPVNLPINQQLFKIWWAQRNPLNPYQQ